MSMTPEVETCIFKASREGLIQRRRYSYGKRACDTLFTNDMLLDKSYTKGEIMHVFSFSKCELIKYDRLLISRNNYYLMCNYSTSFGRMIGANNVESYTTEPKISFLASSSYMESFAELLISHNRKLSE